MQVIYHLNTRNDDHETEVKALVAQHEVGWCLEMACHWRLVPVPSAPPTLA